MKEGIFKDIRVQDLQSEAWEKFGKVVDANTAALLQFVVCLHPVCSSSKIFNKGGGTLVLKNRVCHIPAEAARDVTNAQNTVKNSVVNHGKSTERNITEQPRTYPSTELFRGLRRTDISVYGVFRGRFRGFSSQFQTS